MVVRVVCLLLFGGVGDERKGVRGMGVSGMDVFLF